jgi:hypothetical protein
VVLVPGILAKPYAGEIAVDKVGTHFALEQSYLELRTCFRTSKRISRAEAIDLDCREPINSPRWNQPFATFLPQSIPTSDVFV